MKEIGRVRRWIQGGRSFLEHRLTSGGWLVLFGLFVTTGIGFPITDQSVAYKASTFLAVLLGFSLLWSVLRRDRLRLARVLPRYGTVGETLGYRVRVENGSAEPLDGMVWREVLGVGSGTDARNPRSFVLTGGAGPDGGGGSGLALDVPVRLGEQNLPPVAPHGFVEQTASMIPLRRGVLRLSRALVARPDPLGLSRSITRSDLTQSVVILPRRHPLPPLALPGSPRLQAGGVAQASSVGESEEFIGLRDYRRGDSPRKIHWKSWARAGRPVVKEYQDEFFVRHALILDTFVSRNGAAAFEEAVSIAASFACTVPSQESLLDLLFVEVEPVVFTVGRAVAHPEQMLEVLAGVGAAAGPPFVALQQLVLQHVRLVCGCVAVLLAWDEPRRELVRRLTGAGVPLMVLVVTEEDAPSTQQTEGVRADWFHWIHPARVREGLARL